MQGEIWVDRCGVWAGQLGAKKRGKGKELLSGMRRKKTRETQLNPASRQFSETNVGGVV